jgi:hypothetical protein
VQQSAVVEQQQLQEFSTALLQQLGDERRQLQQQLLAASQECAAAVAELGCLRQQLEHAQRETASKSTLVESLQQQLSSALVRAHLADCWRALATMKVQLSSALGPSGQQPQLQTQGGAVQVAVLQQALLAAQQGAGVALQQHLAHPLVAAGSPWPSNPAVSSTANQLSPASGVGDAGGVATSASGAALTSGAFNTISEVPAALLQVQQLVGAPAAQLGALQQQQQQQLLLAGLQHLLQQQQQPLTSMTGPQQQLAMQQAAALLGQQSPGAAVNGAMPSASQAVDGGSLSPVDAPATGSSMQTERSGS